MIRAAAIALLAVSFAGVAMCSAQTPTLYVTMHGGSSGVNALYSFDLSGNPLSTSVLQGDPNISGLRSALLRQDGTMLVVNSDTKDSRIAVYSGCDSAGARSYDSDFADTNLAHPYGIAINADDTTVWASNQDTYDIVQFNNDSGDFEVQVKQFGTEELRSIAFDDVTGVLYIANETEDAVLAYDSLNSNFLPSYNFEDINDPIGLFVDSVNRVIYVGSNGDGSVVAYSLESRQLIQTYTDPNLDHPAGIVVYDDQLFVISQKAGTVMLFNTTSGALISTVISSFPDTPEQLVLSMC